MSEQVQRRSPARPTKRPATRKAENRTAAKAAKRTTATRKARLQRLRQSLQAGLGGLVVLGAIIGVVLLFGDSGRQSPAGASASASADDQQFPPLPKGADPALATKPVVTAGSGELTELKVTTLIEGTGPAAQNGQWLIVNYVGVSYLTGAEFDASWNRSDPFVFQLGENQVIDGWDQGLVGVKEGSRVQLDIPSELAYGDNGRIPGPLRFVIDVLAVR